MKIEKTKAENVLLIKPDVFEDHRGQCIYAKNSGIKSYQNG